MSRACPGFSNLDFKRRSGLADVYIGEFWAQSGDPKTLEVNQRLNAGMGVNLRKSEKLRKNYIRGQKNGVGHGTDKPFCYLSVILSDNGPALGVFHMMTNFDHDRTGPSRTCHARDNRASPTQAGSGPVLFFFQF